MPTNKERIASMQKYIDQGYSLSYAKFYGDKDLGFKPPKGDKIHEDPDYLKMKKKYKDRIKFERSYHKCVD